jgi:spore coat protein CotH
MTITRYFALTLFLTAGFGSFAVAQTLPLEMHFSADGRRLITGNQPAQGFYDESIIRTVNLEFPQANYWSLMAANYQSQTEIPAALTVDGETYDSVGVRFKGQTSYSQNQSQKKSFAVSMDYQIEGQDLMGNESLNFNGCFLDPSFIREVMYLHLSRRHLPSAKGNFIHLTLNGQNWGLYANIQNLSGDYLKEWFLSNQGTRWRGEKVGGFSPGGPGGNPFNAGKSSLNYLGADTSLYTPHYTLKKTYKANPWDDLVKTCDVLNNTPAALLEDSLKNYLDVDRTLWFLAHEILFTDDDSYVWKGGMDYYLYWEPETGRMVPLEYDGNTCMDLELATQWPAFYRQNDVKYALMNKLFPVPALRQRYAAHVRTILQESFNLAFADSLVDAYVGLIDAEVQSDPKKIYSYAQFQSQTEEIKDFILARRAYLLSNPEIAAAAPVVGEVTFSSDGLLFRAPAAGQTAAVTAEASAAAGLQGVRLYYATGLVGPFERADMYDDGAHGDGAAGDGVFGADLPAYPVGTYVRFYVEAVSANSYHTVSYAPKGAEHDVFVYQVRSAAEVAINELMALNDSLLADPNGQFEDWIELFNTGDQELDLSGWFLSDTLGNPAKWSFPAGTLLPAGGYLIVWADEDQNQEGLHANFKLAGEGEELILSSPDTVAVQQISFPAQVANLAYARVPNGTGNFVIQAPTFAANNDGVSGTAEPLAAARLRLFPNPTTGTITVETEAAQEELLEVFNVWGVRVWNGRLHGSAQVELGGFPSGVYLVKAGRAVERVVLK